MFTVKRVFSPQFYKIRADVLLLSHRCISHVCVSTGFAGRLAVQAVVKLLRGLFRRFLPVYQQGSEGARGCARVVSDLFILPGGFTVRRDKKRLYAGRSSTCGSRRRTPILKGFTIHNSYGRRNPSPMLAGSRMAATTTPSSFNRFANC